MIVDEVLGFAGRELFPHVLAHLVADVGLGKLRNMRRAQPPATHVAVERDPVFLPATPALSVLSHVPGRVRVGVPAVRGQVKAAATLAETLQRMPGVVSAAVSAPTGSVLVYYDPVATTVAQLQAVLTVCDGRAAPCPAAAGREPPLAIAG